MYSCDWLAPVTSQQQPVTSRSQLRLQPKGAATQLDLQRLDGNDLSMIGGVRDRTGISVSNNAIYV